MRLDSKTELQAYVDLKDASAGTRPRIMPFVLSTFLVVLIGYCWRR